jgi:hypothetical protein
VPLELAAGRGDVSAGEDVSAAPADRGVAGAGTAGGAVGSGVGAAVLGAAAITLDGSIESPTLVRASVVVSAVAAGSDLVESATPGAAELLAALRAESDAPADGR